MKKYNSNFFLSFFLQQFFTALRYKCFHRMEEDKISPVNSSLFQEDVSMIKAPNCECVTLRTVTRPYKRRAYVKLIFFLNYNEARLFKDTSAYPPSTPNLVLCLKID